MDQARKQILSQTGRTVFHSTAARWVEHNCAIEFMRNDFERTKVHPVVRSDTIELQREFGSEKGSVKYFHTLFPLGIHQTFLIVGLPMKEPCC